MSARVCVIISIVARDADCISELNFHGYLLFAKFVQLVLELSGRLVIGILLNRFV